jgi:hypothetical protein
VALNLHSVWNLNLNLIKSSLCILLNICRLLRFLHWIISCSWWGLNLDSRRNASLEPHAKRRRGLKSVR